MVLICRLDKRSDDATMAGGLMVVMGELLDLKQRYAVLLLAKAKRGEGGGEPVRHLSRRRRPAGGLARSSPAATACRRHCLEGKSGTSIVLPLAEHCEYINTLLGSSGIKLCMYYKYE